MMSRPATALLGILLLAGCAGAPSKVQPSAGAPPDRPGEEIVVVEVEGEVNVIPGNAIATREAGLMAAQKKAVEKALGVMVTGQVVVSQAQVIEDGIFSKTAGYMKSWEVLSERDEDGVHFTKIRARVKFGDVKKDVDSLGLLIRTKKVGNPRVMILIDEKIDGVASDGKTVETGLASALLEKGYKVVDADQLSEIRNQAAVVKAAMGDEKEAAEVGRRLGAEVAIVGSAKSSFFTDQGLEGMFSYRGTLALKAVKTGSGQVVLAVSKSGGGMDLSKEMAATQNLTRMTEEAGAEISEKLAPALWEGASVVIALSGITGFDALNVLVETVRSLDGIGSVTTRSFTAGEAVLDVELRHGNASTLAAQMEAAKTPFEIKEVAADRIVAAPASKEGGSK